MDLTTALDLLEQESAQVDALVAGLPPAQWTRLTPAAGWTVADQIAHLHWTDTAALQSVSGDPAFDELLRAAAQAGASGFVDSEAHRLAAVPQEELLAAWRRGRARLAAALREADPGERLRWFGPPMRPLSMVTARIMETWAHGLDVFDALAVPKPAGPALAAVARLGVRTRGFSFASRGLEAPDAEVRVELELPGAEPLAFGPAEAADRVTGSAWGFAAVVTQRRNLADVDLAAEGEGAQAWLDIAQAFAGGPTQGPAPGERVTAGTAAEAAGGAR